MNNIDIADEIQRMLSDEISKGIDAEILKNIMAIATNQVRKKSIRKIFNTKASE